MLPSVAAILFIHAISGTPISRVKIIQDNREYVHRDDSHFNLSTVSPLLLYRRHLARVSLIPRDQSR